MMRTEGTRGVLLTLCVCFLLVNMATARVPVSAAPRTTFSVNNTVPDTPGGKRFMAELGDAWTIKMLKDVRVFILKALSLGPVNAVEHVTLILEDTDKELVAYNTGTEIHVGADFLAGVNSTLNLRVEFKGLMIHELCHSFQNWWRGNYSTDPHFTGVVEGIADYLVLVAGIGQGPKTPKEKGGHWFDTYKWITPNFFAWIDQTQTKGFVNMLNQKMGLADWNDVFFKDITGKDVNTLWTMYQASF